MPGDVHEGNALRALEEAKRQARLAHSAHTYFTKNKDGKELYSYLKHQAGMDLPAFSPKDNFNAYGAAFRDGMRASVLKIENLIEHHRENHETTKGQD